MFKFLLIFFNIGVKEHHKNKMEKIQNIKTLLIKEQVEIYNKSYNLLKELYKNNFEFKEYHWQKQEYKDRFNKYIGDKETKFKKFVKWLQLQHNKKVNEITTKYDDIMSYGELKRKIYITVEWKKSNMWGG